jgi:hypothetical protein
MLKCGWGNPINHEEFIMSHSIKRQPPSGFGCPSSAPLLKRYPSPEAMAAALGTSRYPFRDHGTCADHAPKTVQL